MNNKEFLQYRKNLTQDIKIDNEGHISGDNVVRYTLFFGNVAKEQIMGVTIGEAIYRSIILLSFQELNELIKANLEADDRILALADFSEYSAKVECDNLEDESKHNYITIKHNDSVYTLKVSENDTKNIAAIDNVTDVSIDDNMVKVFYMYDNVTTICNIVNSPYSMVKFNLNDNMPLDRKFSTAMEYLRLLSTNISLFLGYSSPAEDDAFNATIGNELAYKRAILEKIRIDKLNYNYMIKESTKSLSTLSRSISGFKRTLRTLNRRQNQIEKSINEIIK